jgi:hypothetical protein
MSTSINAVSLTITEPDIIETFRERVAEDLQLLASIHDREPDSVLIQELKSLDFPFCLTLLPDTGPGAEVMILMPGC